MVMKRGLLLLLIAITFCFAGCKKDTNPIPATDEYLPLTNGSTWHYSYSTDAGNTDTLTLQMTGGTTLISGKTYYNISSIDNEGSSMGYFYVGNHNYATRTTDNGTGSSIELQLLNDTASVGYTWITNPTANGQLGGDPVRTMNTIKEKNISRVINGKTFTHVIHTEVQLQYNFGNGFETSVIYDFYLAKGVGMIETDANTLGTFYETETLFDYTIK
jgi:hypothetical protein